MLYIKLINIIDIVESDSDLQESHNFSELSPNTGFAESITYWKIFEAQL